MKDTTGLLEPLKSSEGDVINKKLDELLKRLPL